MELSGEENSSPALGLLTFLNEQIFGDEDLCRRMGDELAAGRLVSVRDAFKAPFAERVFAALDAVDGWRPYEKFTDDHFHYHHHNIYDDSLAPPELRLCHGIFGSGESKAFIGGMARRDCSGPLQLSASRYLPGDYSLPHSDLVALRTGGYRQVAFVWHLTRDWRTTWGGDLFWCPTGSYISPSFNTLHLFCVTPESLHFVTPVSPYAQSKRMAVNGWWTGPELVAPSSTADARTLSAGVAVF